MIIDYLIFVKLAFLVIAFLVFINWEVFYSEIKKIDKKYFIGLIILFLFAVFIFKSNLSFFPSYHEWGMLSAAKHLSSQTFYQEKEGLLYPAILALLFKILGANPEVAVLLNLFFSVSCVFLVFLLVRIIFGSDGVAFVSVLFFLLNPLTLWYFFIKSGWPAVTCFWFLCILLVFSVFLKNPKNFSLAILAVILIALAAQIRAEFFILVLLVPLVFILHLRPLRSACKTISMPKMALFFLIFTAVFLFFLIPDISKNSLRKNESGGGTCGYWTSETKLLNGEISRSSNAFIEKTDGVIRSVLNSRFSLYYVLDDLFFLRIYFKIPLFWLMLFFAIFGIVYGIKKQPKIIIVNFSMIFLICAVYILDCTYFISRYFAPLYGLFVIFVGGGINFFLETAKKYLDKKYLKLGALFIIALFVLVGYKDLALAKNIIAPPYYNYDGTEMTDYKKIKDVLYKIEPSQSAVISMFPGERDVLSFLDYSTPISISGEISLDNINFHQNKSKFYKSFQLPLEKSKSNYLLVNNCYFELRCSQKEVEELVDYIFKNHGLNKVFSNDVYSLFKFEVQSK